MTTMTIKEAIEKCESRRAENTKAYRDAVRKTNEKIKEYETYKAKMYREAENFVSMWMWISGGK